MMEFAKNQYITNASNFKDFVTVAFILVSDLYAEYTPTEIQHRRGVERMVMSDTEIITISIVGELMSIDSERAWYSYCRKNLADLFPHFCERSRFNRVHRNLYGVILTLYQKITKFLCFCGIMVIDSLPLPVCKFGRAHFHKTFRGYGACYGKCASKKETYFGYKLHMICALDGYPVSFLLTGANVDDRKPVAALVADWEVSALLADKGYNGADFQRSLLERFAIPLFPAPKSNDFLPPEQKMLRQLIFKARRRIETTGSQLADQLNLQRVRAKSLWGLITRLASKFFAFSIAYLINLLSGSSNPVAIKHLIF